MLLSSALGCLELMLQQKFKCNLHKLLHPLKPSVLCTLQAYQGLKA